MTVTLRTLEQSRNSLLPTKKRQRLYRSTKLKTSLALFVETVRVVRGFTQQEAARRTHLPRQKLAAIENAEKLAVEDLLKIVRFVDDCGFEVHLVAAPTGSSDESEPIVVRLSTRGLRDGGE